MGDPSFDDDSESVNAHDQFHNAYGAVMTAWARVEGCLFYWFMSASGMEEPLARAIYFSAKSFMGRRDMLRAAIPFSRLDEDAPARSSRPASPRQTGIPSFATRQRTASRCWISVPNPQHGLNSFWRKAARWMRIAK
jgi:hypothetical protein